MKKSQIEVGKSYTAKVSGDLVAVRIDAVHPLGGWLATNKRTGRQVRILTAARLRDPVLTTVERATLGRAIAGAMLAERAMRGVRYSANKRGARICLEGA